MLLVHLARTRKSTGHYQERALLKSHRFQSLPIFFFLGALLFCEAPATLAQINVITQRNDVARTGANISETILTPSNVNTNTFGKLFSFPVDGWIYAQPLYMSGVIMGAGTPQAGTTHNVVFITTEHDSVYAFDANSNLGSNARPLWQITLLDNAHGVPAGITATTVPSSDVSTTDIIPEIGITSTGVIDPSTKTLYLVGKTKEASGSTTSYVQRLHALDITTGAENFGGPVTLQAAVAGFGSGSSSGIVNWDPLWENNRAGLLLLNGIVYIAFASHGDNGPWHGWILAYNASTLNQTGAWCATPNGIGAGTWTSGAALAADVPDPSGHPFGRIITATGNGNFDASPSYTNSMDYGDSIITLDLSNGVPTVVDDFTPHDQATLSNGDQDVGSGGVLLLPDSVGGGNHILTQVGKNGRIYVLNQDNLGGYNPSNTTDPGEAAYINGLWGIPAYWNGNVYVWGVNDNLKVFPISNGVLSSTYASKSNEFSNQYSPSPSISANGTASGIVWSLKTDNYNSNGREILYAHDATNVANLLYSSESNVTRDNPGNSVKFIVPTIANGKVYVGSESQVSVFGLLSGATQAATPVISPASQSFNSSLQVTIADSSAGATIYYTTDGSQPTTASTVYSGPFAVTSTTTVNAMAAGSGLLQSPVATATYTLSSQASGGSINFSSGFSGSNLVLQGSAKLSGTALELTDGGPSEASSAWFTSPVNVQTFTTDFRFQITPSGGGTADGFTFAIQNAGTTALGPSGGGLGYGPDTPGGTPGIPNSVAIKFDLYDNAGEGTNSTGLYINGASPTTPAVALGGAVSLQSGDVLQVHMTYNGTTLTMTITDTTNSSQTFTTSWTINIPATVGANAAYVGFTAGTGGLVATQQILNWTFTGGATTQPTLTSIAVTPANPSAPAGTTVQFHATGTYSDNSTKDLTSSVTWTSSNTSVATINSSGLANAVAAGTATISAASGSISGSTTLTVTATTPPPSTINYSSGFSSTGLALNGSASINGTLLQLTDGGANEASSAWFTSPVNVQTFTTDFRFQITPSGGGTADGFTFAIQNAGTTALGPSGGGLGYGPDTPGGTAGIPNSVAIKFDLYDNAGEGTNSTGLYINGASPTTPAVTLGGGVNLQSGDVLQAHLTYNGTTLTMTITDTANTSQTFTTSWTINIPGTVGGNTAFVGFTGGTGGLTATQDILSWTYGANGTTTPSLASITVTPANPSASAGTTVQFHATGSYSDNSTKDVTASVTWTSSNTSVATINSSGLANAVAAGTAAISAASGSISGSTTLTVTATTPPPSTINYSSGFSSTGLALNGSASINGTLLQLTDGGANEASSAWFASPVNVQTFTTDFSFQISPGGGTADGFTFAIQNAGTAALGPSGGGLGYGPDTPGGTPGIPNSVAIKFDLYDNAGEGTNSTGLYINGASPTTPAVTLGGGVNLQSGDVLQVHMTYDGTTLTMTITDTANASQTFTTNWTVNIPATVGGNTAFVGFTGGTGGLTATQDILSWTY